ncbi:hypothetical protein [Culturomica massiliensis]|uniref:hypothetical protein n=1 Tax=Culturomica massiliensis TaxID=1841857 RepID=UPI00266FA428|nr:hypothetical protein [Culturomica massiliensis]
MCNILYPLVPGRIDCLPLGHCEEDEGHCFIRRNDWMSNHSDLKNRLGEYIPALI